MLSIPAPLAELGVSGELKAALLKLSAGAAGLAPGRRGVGPAAVPPRPSRLVGRGRAGAPPPHVHRAVWQDRRLRLTYRLPFDAQATWRVDPFGLVAKASTWHLVCRRDGHLRVLRVSRVADARLGDETFARPPGFDLAAFWGAWCAKVEANRSSYLATVRVAPQAVPWLSYHFGQQLRDEIAQAGSPEAGQRDAEGWITLALPFESLDEARIACSALAARSRCWRPRPARQRGRLCRPNRGSVHPLTGCAPTKSARRARAWHLSRGCPLAASVRRPSAGTSPAPTWKRPPTPLQR